MIDSSVDILTEWDIVEARQLGRNEAKKIGFGAVDQARITTAISELARNIYLYADSGNIIITAIEIDGIKGIKVVAKDEGPGINDIRLVMQDGYSTSQGLGAGLPGVRRLMDEFEIHTVLDEGTIVSIIKWLRLGSE